MEAVNFKLLEQTAMFVDQTWRTNRETKIYLWLLPIVAMVLSIAGVVGAIVALVVVFAK